nr:hypothetical protein [Nitrospirota bacterium]
VLEEAQQSLLSADGDVAAGILPLLEGGGWAFVSYRPDRLDQAVLREMHHCLLTRMTEPESVQAVQTHCKTCGTDGVNMAALAPGSALLCGGPVVRLRPAIRRVPHTRHHYKYLDVPLSPEKRFRFRDARTDLGKEAASLYELLHLLPSLPIASLEYHDQRQDLVRWVEGSLGDAELAARLRKLSNRQLQGEGLREAFRQTVAAHYAELTA